MYKKANPLFLICETPLHAGSGSELGIVDLPIQRERHTDYPKIEASSLKGSLREAFEAKAGDEKEKEFDVHRIFGYDELNASDEAKKLFKGDKGKYAGAVGFTDARILLFPVKSVKGVYAWITSPDVIQRLVDDLNSTGRTDKLSRPQANTCCPDSDVVVKNNSVVLEEFCFQVNHSSDTQNLAKWLADNALPAGPEYTYWRTKIKKDLIVLTNEAFRDFVQMSTDVITRTKIDNKTGTVQQGALFTEEYLPTDAILYTLALFSPLFSPNKGKFEQKNSADEIEAWFKKQLPGIVQIGGNATLGKGLVRTRMEV